MRTTGTSAGFFRGAVRFQALRDVEEAAGE